MKKLTTIKINNPIFFITPNPIYAIGLEKAVQNYFVICSQKADVVSYFKENNVTVLCLDNNEIKNAGKILMNKKVIEYIKEKSKNQKANIISFKPSPMIQKICDDNEFNYLGNSWKLSRDLEDKIKFIKIAEKLKIPNAESGVIKLDENKCSLDFSKKNKFVIQLPRGFSGNATFLIKSKTDFAEILKKYKNRKAKLSKYLEGETYTINACVTKNKILVSQPIFQITGLSAYNKNKFGTCGNDYVYPKKLKKEQRKKIFDYTKKVGDYIKSLNYKGIFGLDFVVGDNKREEAELPIGSSASGSINLIEINPRIIGSMSLFTKLQIQNKEVPFLLSHILEFMSFKSREQACLFSTCDELKFFNASQLILRNTRNNPIKITKSLKSGIYEIKKNRLVFKGEAYCSNRRLNKTEFLIQCSLKGRVVSPDIEYANVQVNYGIMESEKEFKSCFEKKIKIILENIKYSISKI
ncbi:MAG: ATP-grasp domain-containing protein [Candidatus Pacebacteria bacterium]|nr:ATP-grasp domain-containing protein [Candidatus Paceibacterota bacterium]